MAVNNEYKDSVFTCLFSDEDRLRELYNAIEGSNYNASVKITINTLQDVLFKDRINDISFTLDDKLVVLIEHQSTINYNMPLRFLIYVARIYEKIVAPRAIYKTAMVKIPKPEFIVLYNGVEDMPDVVALRLSDAFIALKSDEKPELELAVKVYNVNPGHNEEMLKKSEH
jgi:hypothetical protein